MHINLGNYRSRLCIFFSKMSLFARGKRLWKTVLVRQIFCDQGYMLCTTRTLPGIYILSYSVMIPFERTYDLLLDCKLATAIFITLMFLQLTGDCYRLWRKVENISLEGQGLCVLVVTPCFIMHLFIHPIRHMDITSLLVATPDAVVVENW